MSLQIAVYREGRFRRFLKLSKAQKKVASGRYRWRDAWAAIEEVEAHLRRLPGQVFENGPSARMTDWMPRPSGGFLVMQLNTTDRVRLGVAS